MRPRGFTLLETLLALMKIRAGATLIQLYSSLVYKGLGLVEDIKAAQEMDPLAVEPVDVVGQTDLGEATEVDTTVMPIIDVGGPT